MIFGVSRLVNVAHVNFEKCSGGRAGFTFQQEASHVFFESGCLCRREAPIGLVRAFRFNDNTQPYI